MEKTYYETNHIFTSRTNDPNIYIKAGANETLTIEGIFNEKLLLNNTVVVYGDNYSFLGTPTWPEYLSSISSITTINKSENFRTIDRFTGAFLNQDAIMTPAYNNYSSVLAYGFYDMRIQTVNDIYDQFKLQQWYQLYLNALITLAVKQENIYKPQVDSFTETGTWNDTPGSIFGRYTSDNLASSEITITARYYMFSFGTIGAAPDQQWDIEIDGVYQATCKFIFRIADNSYYDFCTVIDMGTSAERLVKVINKRAGNAYLSCICAWDETSAGRNTIAVSIPIMDYEYTGPLTDWDYNKRDTMNELIEEAVFTCRDMNLPVAYFKERSVNSMVSDGENGSQSVYNSRAREIYEKSNFS